MPADRSAEQPGLIRSEDAHAARAGQTLQRGAACTTCRSRKVRCDGVKPACGACKRSAKAHGENADLLVCTFDDDEAPVKKKRAKKAAGSEKEAELEARIRELEGQLRSQPPQTSFFPPPMSFSSYEPVASTSQMIAPPYAHLPLDAAPPPASPLIGGGVDQLFRLSSIGDENKSPTAGSSDLPAHGWPVDLPNQHITRQLLEVYFDRPHLAHGMVNRARFWTAFELSPSSPGFPPASLVHAMIATAINFVEPSFAGLDGEQYWRANGSPSDHHLRCAKATLDEQIRSGNALLQNVQAIVLVSLLSYGRAAFVELWLYTGLGSRCCAPLGLNHVEACSLHSVTGNRVNAPTLLDPPVDDQDKYERAHTFWLSFMLDRMASSYTTWAMSYSEGDVTTMLPNESIIVQPDVPRPGSVESLSVHSPSFFVSHATPAISSFQLMIKAVILLGRTITFLQRSPWPVGSHLADPTAAQPPATDSYPDLRLTQPFKKLDADSVSFRLSMPKQFRTLKPIRAGRMLPEFDSQLILAHTLPHVATILLHESFCTSNDGDISMARCLTSARAILATLQTLSSASVEISAMNPFLHYCWATTARVLVRQMALRQAASDVEGYKQASEEVQTILAALDPPHPSPTSAIGAVFGAATRHQLQDITQLLPKYGVRPWSGKVTDPGAGCYATSSTIPYLFRSTRSSTSTTTPTPNAPTPSGLDAALANDDLSTWLYDLEKKDENTQTWSEAQLLDLFLPLANQSIL